MKRLLDLFGAILLLILCFPLMIMIAILIKITSRGPVLFKQERLGLNGRVFEIYKFRTMVVNAENIGPGIFTNEKDERITKIGQFLRKTSLDELPQLINILKNEMSFVGPRPPVPYHPYTYDQYSEEQRRRFEVLPGITGLAQVSGRNRLTWDERIEYDVEYVKTQSLLLDFKIILKTFLMVFKKQNVYRSGTSGRESTKF